MRILSAVLFLLIFISILASQTQPTAPDQRGPNLMPMPSSVKMGSGQLTINEQFTIAITGHGDQRMEATAKRLLANVNRLTELPLRDQSTDAGQATLVLNADGPGKDPQQLGENESYHLEITPTGAKISAANPLGVIHGAETFLQLIQITPEGFAVPIITIDDTPRFPWRGLMIDACRHWMPLDVIKRTIDGMAAVKMNVFHWHLSENQGFRIESKKFPKLTELGSNGHFYTQEQAREVIAYARERGIRVVAEFDMPGHATAWFPGYPDIASNPGPYDIEKGFGIFDPAMDPTREETYKFLDAFIGEMTALFPDQFFHVGGDEVNGKAWDANPKIQQFMRSHNLKSNAELQAYFNKRVQEIVHKHNKDMVGWDEILQPDLPKTIVIQSWRGPQSLAQAARQGYRGLLSNGYYLDLGLPASMHYLNEPLSGEAANLTAEEKQRILGGEACMWSEFVTPENVDSRIWPRTAAIAERLWSPQDLRDVPWMYTRLEQESRRLEYIGLKHKSYFDPMLQRIAGTDKIASLKTLAEVVEPVKGYAREGARHYTTDVPLNRVVDASNMESKKARELGDMVQRLVAKQPEPNDKVTMRKWLTKWRDNDKDLQPMLASSSLMKEIGPVSQQLSAIAAVGLQALDYMDSGSGAPDTWRQQQLAFLKPFIPTRENYEQQKNAPGELLIMIAGPIANLVQATAPAH